MAASMKFICSKSTFIQRQSRTIFTQSFLAKYNVGSNKKKKKPVRPLDDFIRHGKHENDLYETSMDLADRFVDPSVARRPKPHPETPKPGWYAAEHPRGRVFDKKPFPLYLKAGKRYLWCACGRSNRQPICDGTHNTYNRIKYKGGQSSQFGQVYPIIFEVEEDGEYWLCNCKQSKNRPFCDGTHRSLPDKK